MKYILALIMLISSSILASEAQKLVIGSEVKAFEKADGLFWVGARFNPSKTTLVDFYSSNNPTSERYIDEHLETIAAYAKENNVDIVILSIVKDEPFEELALKYQDNEVIYFGVDSKKQVFTKLSALYIPYSVIINDKSELVWKGNLSNINYDTLKDLE